MKFMKWKVYIITSVVCLLPICLGLALWGSLPDEIAIHFNINNQPDNWASKGFAVFGLPILMLILQTVCCVINDINAYKYGDRKKLEAVTKWIIPILSVVLQIVTFGYSLGWDLDIRKIVAVIVGGVFIAIGNYLPKFENSKDPNMDTEKAIKINRFIGYATVIMGIAFAGSSFLSPIATIVCLFMLIPYGMLCSFFGIKIGKR